MRKICKVKLNNEVFWRIAATLCSTGRLMNGIELPHDCRSGICGACRVRLVEGRVFGGHEQGDDMIHACQARIVSDLEIVTEKVPDQVAMSARVVNIVRLAPDVCGVDVELPRPLHYLPGQYCKMQFRGFPARCYSPSYPLEGPPDDHLLHFHVRRFPDGTVSSALGRDIRIGHRVRLTGPFGSAFLRPDHSGSIVLVASGTGFAPMWSIAVAAILSGRSVNSFSWSRHESFPRYTCMPSRFAGLRCFPTSRSFRLYRSRRAFPAPFAAVDQPSICRSYRRTTSSTLRVRRP